MTAKKIDKVELRRKCEDLISKTEPREVEYFSNLVMYEMLRKQDKISMAPVFKMIGRKMRRGYALTTVFSKYLEFLIEESLKYPIDIHIPRVGLLKIREIDSIGKRRCWNDNGVHKYRFDTPFDKSVMYRVYHDIFGVESVDFTTPFKLNRAFASSILGKVYKNHPEGGFYSKYIKTKN